VVVLGANVEDSGEALSDAKHGLMSTIALGGSPVLVNILAMYGLYELFASHRRHMLTHQLPQNRSQPAERSDSQARPRKQRSVVAMRCSEQSR
jgi:hypothetical protein